MLHWKYAVESKDMESQEFQDAVNAIEYIKEVKGLADSNQAYNLLVKAAWAPLAIR